MQRSHKLAIASVVLLTASYATSAATMFAPDAGDTGSLSPFPARVLPVLVSVGSDGRISNVAPAYRLSPQFDRLLDKNVAEMISGPAIDERGKPVPSQFILNLAFDAQPRDDGAYDVRFQYVSTQPVPSGKWYWSHVDGRRLALLDESRPNFDRSQRVTYPDRVRTGHTATPPRVQQPPKAPSAAGRGSAPSSRRGGH